MQQLPADRFLKYASHRRKEIRSIILVIACAVIIRIIPLIWAGPYPLGYDVVNYYIPVTEHFEQHWQSIATQFPLYAILLRGIYSTIGGNAVQTVSTMAVAVYCAFAVSLYSLARTIFHFKHREAIVVSIFVSLQLAVLRTTWDLHRDMLALTAMFLAITFVYRSERSKNWRAGAIGLCLVASASDRMIGTYFALTLVVWLIVRRERKLVFPAGVAAGTVILLSLSSYGTLYGNLVSELGVSSGGSQVSGSPYNFENLKMTFVEIDGLLLAPAIYGMYRSRNAVITIRTLVSMAGALTWIILPTAVQLAADRWIILSGIFLSIQASYCIVDVARRVRLKSARVTLPLACLILSLLFAIGYSILPYEHPFPSLALLRTKVQSFVPTTMQFSTIDVQKNGALLSEINTINSSTEPNAIIVGDKTLKGFMEMSLKGNRTFLYFNDVDSMLDGLTPYRDKVPIYFFNFGQNDFLVRFK